MDFCQSIPTPCSIDPGDNYIDAYVPDLNGFKTFCKMNKERKAKFQLVDYSPLQGVTKSFSTWWSSYYKGLLPSLETCLEIIDDYPFPTDEYEEAGDDADTNSMQDVDPSSKN